MTAEINPWPIFESLADLSEEAQEQFLAEVPEPGEGKDFSLSVATIRRRRKLLAPPLTIAALDGDRFLTTWRTVPPIEPVDLVLARGYIAEMPDRRFEAKLVIGLEHQFNNSNKGLASHARVVDGETGHPLPLTNTPFLQGVGIRPGATLNVRLVFLHGKTGQAAAALLKSDLFRAGIRLTRTFNPVFSTATQYLASLTQSLIAAGKNRVVTQGTFGSNDYGSPVGGALGIGDYLLAQLPAEAALRIGDLRLNRATGTVMDGKMNLDANHFLIRLAPSAVASPG
jgi:hypothetical protein